MLFRTVPLEHWLI